MQNLVGIKVCDELVRQELLRCGITVVHGAPHGEIQTTISGRLGSFTFHRSWRYWVVQGNVPLAVARELYADPIGRTDVRVNGLCTCPPPDRRVSWIDDDGRPLFHARCLRELEQSFGVDHDVVRYARQNKYVEDPAAVGHPVITSYHIDSEAGLRLFADTLKERGFVQTVTTSGC